MREKFLARDRDAWTELLAGENTCVTPVLGVAEVAANAHFAARGSFVEARHPVHGAFRQLAPVLAGNARNASRTRSPPREPPIPMPCWARRASMRRKSRACVVTVSWNERNSAGPAGGNGHG
ncbi:MAG: CoA transferase [Gammaproteobacteria bacterium]|nr:CoA transferase [Gammaproteobacteria bacterium]